MELLSVGIDIGTTTSQLVFSRLTIENEASAFSVPRIRIVGKDILYRSQVYFTPFATETVIDQPGLLALIQREFAAAGLSPEQVATGAVIITGEAARKENADLAAAALSSFSGRFVVSTAGPDLESILAGRGSGAARYSRERQRLAVNVDIGGGTTNIAAFYAGEPIAFGCLDIGGRQLRLDEQGRLAYASPSARLIGESLGLALTVGEPADAAALQAIAGRMAELIFRQLSGEDDPLLAAVRTAGSSPYIPPAGEPVLFFSGGVADCVFHQQPDYAFGDIGGLLGRALRQSPAFAAAEIGPSAETLRATVIGAGVHLLTISGSTIAFSPGALPLRDVPVLRLSPSQEESLLAGGAADIGEKLAWFCRSTDRGVAALALSGRRDLSYTQLEQYAESLSRVFSQPGLAALPLLLILEQDMAKALGQALARRLGRERKLICIDGVSVRDGDYVDLDQPIMNDMVIPVMVKTLILA